MSENISRIIIGDIKSPIAKYPAEGFEDADIEDELDLALYNSNDVIDDDDFMDLIFDNLDGSQMHSELDEESGMSSCVSHSDIPNTVLEVLEKLSFEDT